MDLKTGIVSALRILSHVKISVVRTDIVWEEPVTVWTILEEKTVLYPVRMEITSIIIFVPIENNVPQEHN